MIQKCIPSSYTIYVPLKYHCSTIVPELKCWWNMNSVRGKWSFNNCLYLFLQPYFLTSIGKEISTHTTIGHISLLSVWIVLLAVSISEVWCTFTGPNSASLPLLWKVLEPFGFFICLKMSVEKQIGRHQIRYCSNCSLQIETRKLSYLYFP